MDDIKQKLKRFEESCLNTARIEAEETVSQIDKKISENIKQDIQEYEEEKQKEYEKKIIKLEHNYNSKIFQLNNDARHAILQKEEELKKEMLSEIVDKLRVFVGSEKYEEFLIKNINKSKEKLNFENADEISIYVTRNDKEKYGAKLKDVFSCNLYGIDDSYIGGAICTNETKKISVDNTIKELLENEYEIEI